MRMGDGRVWDWGGQRGMRNAEGQEETSGCDGYVPSLDWGASSVGVYMLKFCTLSTLCAVCYISFIQW